MKSNVLISIMLCLAIALTLPSCSLTRGNTSSRSGESVEEMNERIHGKTKKAKKEKEEIVVIDESDQWEKNDTISRPGEESIIMPDAVDVSDYIPPFARDKEKENEAEIAEPNKPVVAPENPALSRDKETRLREEMVALSKEYLGMPYKYGGKKPESGFDCSGLTRYVYRSFGLEIGAASYYQAEDGKKIPLKKTLPGDLIIFGNGSKVNHVAMVVDNNKEGLFVIHSTNRGVVIDNILQSSYWKKRILYARRIVGEDGYPIQE